MQPFIEMQIGISEIEILYSSCNDTNVEKKSPELSHSSFLHILTLPQGYLNDLWYFDPTTQKWTFVEGNGEVNANGTSGMFPSCLPSSSTPPLLII